MSFRCGMCWYNWASSEVGISQGKDLLWKGTRMVSMILFVLSKTESLKWQKG